MQKKDQMHPDDKRNLFIFAVLSIVLWLSYDQFILKPKMEKMRAAQEVLEQAAVEGQTSEGMVAEGERDRNEVIGESSRVVIKSDKVFGSLNLTGARLDDLGLYDYHMTVAREENVNILSPAGSFHPKYIEHGWVSNDKSLKMPDAKTVWRKVAGDVLAPNSPITLRWDNGRGLTFEQVITLNEDYAFQVVRRVINKTRKEISLFPYSIILQRGLPEDFLGRWVVHEGPIGYVDDELIETDFGKMEDDPQVTNIGSKGWIGLTSKDWLTVLVPEKRDGTKYRVTYTKAVNEDVKDRYQTDVLGPAITAPAGGMLEYKTNFFAGAKKLSLLEKYEDQWNVPHMDLAVDFGWYYFMTKPFFYVINFFYGLVGNFGLAIIMFTVVLRIAVFPLANTSCLMLITMIIQRKLSPPPTDKFQAQMIAAMPWIMTFILAQFAAGLVIYWTFNNLLSVIQQYIIMRNMGVEVDLVGNILGRKKEETPIDGVNAEAAVVEEQVEDALGIDQEDTPENAVKKSKPVSKPKPKKSKKKK